MSEALPINISILDKDYKIACPPGEQTALIASAEYLDAKLREIRDSTNNLSTERIAVMTALNIAHELLHGMGQQDDFQQALPARLKQLETKIIHAIEDARQLEI